MTGGWEVGSLDLGQEASDEDQEGRSHRPWQVRYWYLALIIKEIPAFLLLQTFASFWRPAKCDICLNSFFFHILYAVTFLPIIWVTFTSFFKDEKSQNSKNQGFSYYFWLTMVGSWAGSGSVPLTNGSGSGMSKNIRIRIRNSNTVFRIWLNDDRHKITFCA